MMTEKTYGQLIRTVIRSDTQIKHHFRSDHYQKIWTEHSPKMKFFIEEFQKAKTELQNRGLWVQFCEDYGHDPATYSAHAVLQKLIDRNKARESKQ